MLVVTAGMGSGHLAAADELVRRLVARGHVAVRVDVLDLGRPGQGRRLRRTYAFLLRWLPWVYDVAMRFWARWPGPLEALTAHGATAYEHGLMQQVQRVGPDVVVSVYNLSSQALGRLRAAGRLRVPLVTYVTDPGPHPYWVHPAVDLHLATLPASASALESRGAARTCRVAPLVDDRFRAGARGREEARRRLQLPTDAVVALVTGGSWGAGGVERTVERLARSGAVVPVTLCGRNERLRRRLTRRALGLPLGWTDDVASVMAASDVVVDNAGGLTAWEALVCGLPVVIFRPLPGHGRLNAATLEAAGLVAVARTGRQLIPALRYACAPAAVEAVRRRVCSVVLSGDPVAPILQLARPAADRPHA